MSLVHIVVDGVESDVDESSLQRKDTFHDDADATVRTVEYCRIGCQGNAHTTGVADSADMFCAKHVHRSVHVDVKRWPHGMSGLAGAFGS